MLCLFVFIHSHCTPTELLYHFIMGLNFECHLDSITAKHGNNFILFIYFLSVLFEDFLFVCHIVFYTVIIIYLARVAVVMHILSRLLCTTIHSCS